MKGRAHEWLCSPRKNLDRRRGLITTNIVAVGVGADRRFRPDIAVALGVEPVDERLGAKSRRAIPRRVDLRVIAGFVVQIVAEVPLAEVHVVPRVQDERMPELIHMRRGGDGLLRDEFEREEAQELHAEFPFLRLAYSFPFQLLLLQLLNPARDAVVFRTVGEAKRPIGSFRL